MKCWSNAQYEDKTYKGCLFWVIIQLPAIYQHEQLNKKHANNNCIHLFPLCDFPSRL